MIPNALYPMGPVTFAIACSFCKNIGSDKCVRCKCEIESGFELKDRHQMTNADRIRAMTDEELVNFLMRLMGHAQCFAEGIFPYHPCPQEQNCKQCGIDWLKQPSGEEDKHEAD